MTAVAETEVQVSTLTAAPLVNWKKAPELSALKQNLQDAKPIHDVQRSKVSTWLDNFHVRGSAKFKPAAGRSGIQPKLIRKQAEWRYPALSEPFLSRPKLFDVKPKTWEDKHAATQNELLLNHQFNTSFNKVNFIDEYVRTAVEEGTVVVMTSWEFEEEQYKEKEPVIELRLNPQFAETLQQVAKLREESPSQYATDVPSELKQALEASEQHGVAYEPVVVGMREVEKTRVKVNRPTAEICPQGNVVFDPTCDGDISKASFAVRSFETNKAKLSKDKRYKNLKLINVEGSSPLSHPDHVPAGGQHNFNFNDAARKKFVVHEYWGFWDIHGDGQLHPIVAAWVDNVLIRMELNPFPDKALPFVVVQYLPVRKSVYGEPDGELLTDNQKVLGAVTRGMVDLMGRSANGQTGMRKDMLDETNRRKFMRGEDYEFNANVDPRQGVHQHQFPEIPASAQFMLQLQNFEAESLSGVKSFTQGVSGNSLGDVAAGVRGALDAASKRELGILRRLADGLVQIGRKFISMNAELLSEEEVVRVSNEQFVPVRRDDLAGNVDLELTISSAEEDALKVERLTFLLQTTGNNMDPAMRNMILSEIARLGKMPDLAHQIETYEPQPDPLTVKKAELELELLQAQINKENALAAEANARAGLNGAKAGTEQAKQGNLQADTDRKNLDFVEQESGTTQERALQLHGEQARAQGELKMLDRAIDVEEGEKDRQADLIKEWMKANKPNTSK